MARTKGRRREEEKREGERMDGRKGIIDYRRGGSRKNGEGYLQNHPLGFSFSRWDTPLPVSPHASWGVLFWKSDSFFILGES